LKDSSGKIHADGRIAEQVPYAEFDLFDYGANQDGSPFSLARLYTTKSRGLSVFAKGKVSLREFIVRFKVKADSF
jgi:hypothetical protein